MLQAATSCSTQHRSSAAQRTRGAAVLSAVAAVVSSAIVGTGCNARQPEADAPPAQPAAPSRAQTIADTIMLEGMAEPITSTLVHSPEGVEPRFSTYVPPGLVTEMEAQGDTAWVAFNAAFAGQTDPNAYMHVRLYPRGIDYATAREVLEGFLRSREPQDDPVGVNREQPPHRPVEAPLWGAEAHAFEYAATADVRYAGRIVLGQHGGRFFHVLTHYPVEYGDGLGPRFERILHHWRWEDTGLMLRASPAEAHPPN